MAQGRVLSNGFVFQDLLTKTWDSEFIDHLWEMAMLLFWFFG